MMKLSEAIMLGSTMKPQGTQALIDGLNRTCALGAALDAIGKLDSRNQVIEPLFDEWPWSKQPWDCPRCRIGAHDGTRANWTVTGIAAHLNDAHLWTRERIAEWVASIEPQDKQIDVGQGPVVASLEVPAV